jgi:hypothetical protein
MDVPIVNEEIHFFGTVEVLAPSEEVSLVQPLKLSWGEYLEFGSPCLVPNRVLVNREE